jgi:hypothetical protein
MLRKIILHVEAMPTGYVQCAAAHDVGAHAQVRRGTKLARMASAQAANGPSRRTAAIGTGRAGTPVNWDREKQKYAVSFVARHNAAFAVPHSWHCSQCRVQAHHWSLLL